LRLRHDRPDRSIAISLVTAITYRQINALMSAMGAVLRPDLWFRVGAAAGERIVAFGRPGKSPERRFWQAAKRPPYARYLRDLRIGATVSKARWR
jgi:hypothetical protein